MPEQDNIERVWDLVEKVGVGMLTTRFSGCAPGRSSRGLTATNG
jgi:hypothetical protein